MPYYKSAATKYILPILAGGNEPIDATTYFCGFSPYPLKTTSTASAIIVPLAGTITKVVLFTFSSPTAGTNENWPFYIRLNDAADTALTAVAANTAIRDHSKSGLSIPVVAGDSLVIKTVCPTWATNPASTWVQGYIYIEC